MERHFYFFRHGQTNENQIGKRYGDGIDAYLTEVGIKQAEMLAEFLSGKDISTIYSSPYPRAIHTAKIAIKDCTEIITNEALTEASFGFWWAETDERYPRILNNFNRIKNYFENEVIPKSYGNVAISSHGGVTRALCWACGHKVGEIQNGQCFHFVLKDGKWQFIETFVPEIKD